MRSHGRHRRGREARGGLHRDGLARAQRPRARLPGSKAKVEEAAARLGYVVSSNASSLASGRTRNIGVVVPFLNRWFFSSVLEGAQQALLRSGYDLTLYNLSGDGRERASVFEHFLLRQRVDAVIAVSLELTEPEVARLHELGKPLVGVGGPIPGVRTLTIDDVAVARLATEHLIGLGHTPHRAHRRRPRVRHGLPPADATAASATRARCATPASTSTRGCSPRPTSRSAAGTTPRSSCSAPRTTGPTAIFAASDEMAIGSILAARDLGLVVPRDVSIMGIDDHDLADFFGLTTVAQFPRVQGEMAVEILMDELEPGNADAATPAATPLPYELRVRSSTARPPA